MAYSQIYPNGAPYGSGQGVFNVPQGAPSTTSSLYGNGQGVLAAPNTAPAASAQGGTIDPAAYFRAHPGDTEGYLAAVAASQGGVGGGTLSTYPGGVPGYQESSDPQQSNSGGPTIAGTYTGPGSAASNNLMNAPLDVTNGLGGGGGSSGGDGRMGGGGGAAGGGNNGLGGLLNGLSGAPQGSSGNQLTLPPMNLGSNNLTYQNPTLGPTQSGGGSVGNPTNQPGMATQSPQDALNNYYNTPGYQMLFGNQAVQNFQQSPGYQYAVNQALLQTQQNAASKGLLESGRVMRDMTSTAQNLANQDYNNWWTNQANQYNNYQNRLQGLAGGSVGADQANALGTNLANTSLQTGNNIASLFGNQANAGLGGIINTGAAQVNALGQAAATQAQIQSANQSTALAGAIAAGNQQQQNTAINNNAQRGLF